MKVFSSNKCGRSVGPEEFGELADLVLVSATAYDTVPEYPVDFGKPPEVKIEVDKEFSVLSDWRGLVLTQGFDKEV